MEQQLKVEQGVNMSLEQCPVCKTVLLNIKNGEAKCTACNAMVSNADLDSKFGYEWTKELEDLQDAQS